MTPPARVASAIEILDLILSGVPAEKGLTTWGRTHRFAGSGDRAAIRDHVYDGLRSRRSLAALGGSETGRGIMIGLLRRDGPDPVLMFTGVGHAPAPLTARDAPSDGMTEQVRFDLPDWVYPHISAALGPDTEAVLRVLQTRAPVFLRVNLRRATLDQVMASLTQDEITTVPHPNVKTALQVVGNARKIQQSQAYKTGLVEFQDASSQAAVLRLPLRPGQRVLDYCAGGGGKALAIAALAAVKITAHDADPRRMADLAPRAMRAGEKIPTVTTAELADAGPFDLVLIDAPCSGSGTWRRTPDAKWRFTVADLDRLCTIQTKILNEASTLVAPGGVLAYATCSILGQENQAQVAAFTALHPFELRDETQWLPSAMGDGFYLAVMQQVDRQPSVALRP
jgi:16S rRNA (cytosine967-C5)-methyltransferase